MSAAGAGGPRADRAKPSIRYFPGGREGVEHWAVGLAILAGESLGVDGGWLYSLGSRRELLGVGYTHLAFACDKLAVQQLCES